MNRSITTALIIKNERTDRGVNEKKRTCVLDSSFFLL